MVTTDRDDELITDEEYPNWVENEIEREIEKRREVKAIYTNILDKLN